MTNPPMQPKFEYAFSISLTLGRAMYLRPSVLGADRAAVYVTDGKIEGPLLNGKVMPGSGGDWPLVRPDGVIDFDARYMLELDDGTLVYMQNRGFRWGSPEVMQRLSNREEVGYDEYYMRTCPRFDVPKGAHDWLAKHIFVGIGEKIPEGNRINYFKIL